MQPFEIAEILHAINSGGPFSIGLRRKYTYSQIWRKIEEIIASRLAHIEDRKIQLTAAGRQFLKKNRTASKFALDDLPDRKVAQIEVRDIFVPRRS
jgi:hypothetical protein